MIEKFKILGKYIKDLSSETPDIETYVFVRERISKYQLSIDINSKALKNKMIEVNDLYHDQMLIACNADALPVELRCLLSEQKCYRFSLFSRGFE